jgi:hypothetical protein
MWNVTKVPHPISGQANTLITHSKSIKHLSKVGRDMGRRGLIFKQVRLQEFPPACPDRIHGLTH